MCRLTIHRPVRARTTYPYGILGPPLRRFRRGSVPCHCLRLPLDFPRAQGRLIQQRLGESPCRVELSSQQETRSRKSGSVGTFIRKDAKRQTRGFPKSGPTASTDLIYPDKPSRKRSEFHLDFVGIRKAQSLNS